ncbi:hypothetical protein BJ742DRAFT_843336 [Cladochytrium replicatum]|nr:hypothetical protein BJ742DRAFT_843336 [Cladochytrium replicatum]
MLSLSSATTFSTIHDKPTDATSPELFAGQNDIEDEFEYIFSEYQPTACSSPSINGCCEFDDFPGFGCLLAAGSPDSQSCTSIELSSMDIIGNQDGSDCDGLGDNGCPQSLACDRFEERTAGQLDQLLSCELSPSPMKESVDDTKRELLQRNDVHHEQTEIGDPQDRDSYSDDNVHNFSKFAVSWTVPDEQHHAGIVVEGSQGEGGTFETGEVSAIKENGEELFSPTLSKLPVISLTTPPDTPSPTPNTPNHVPKELPDSRTLPETHSPTTLNETSRSAHHAVPRRPTTNPFSANYVRKTSARKVSSSNRKVSNSSIVKLLQEDPTAVEEVSALLDELLSHRGSPRRGVKALKSFWESTTAAANIGSRSNEHKPRTPSIWGLRQRKQPRKPSGGKEAVGIEKQVLVSAVPPKVSPAPVNTEENQTSVRQEKELTSQVVELRQQKASKFAANGTHREQDVSAFPALQPQQHGEDVVDSVATSITVESSFQPDVDCAAFDIRSLEYQHPTDGDFVEIDGAELESQIPIEQITIQNFFRSPHATAHATAIAASTVRSTSLAVLAVEEEITHIETIQELEENEHTETYEFVWPQSQSEEVIEEVVVVFTNDDEVHSHEDETTASHDRRNTRRKGKSAYGPMTIDAFGNLIRKNRAIRTFGPDGIHAYADNEEGSQEPDPSATVKRSSTFFKFLRGGRLWRRATPPPQPQEEVLFRDPEEAESPKDDVSLTTTSAQLTLVDMDASAPVETRKSGGGWWDAMKKKMRGSSGTERSAVEEA